MTPVLLCKNANIGLAKSVIKIICRARNASTAVSSDGTILFGWEDNTGTGTAKANDKVILVAFFTETKRAIFTIGVAMRKDGQALLERSNMQGETAETWIGVLSNDEEDAADSVYTGAVEL